MKTKSIKIIYEDGSSEIKNNVVSLEDIPNIWARVNSLSQVEFIHYPNDFYPEIEPSRTKYEALCKRICVEFTLEHFLRCIKDRHSTACALFEALRQERFS